MIGLNSSWVIPLDISSRTTDLKELLVAFQVVVGKADLTPGGSGVQFFKMPIHL